jgi:uncharacterized membrane protein (DUF2068 family)
MTEASTLSARTRPKGAGLLRAIGVFKLLKGALLIAVAISVFNLVHKDLAAEIIELSRKLHIAPGNQIVQRLIDRVLTVTNRQLVVLGIVLLVYSMMFIVEGTGLLLLKHWAEWMTVITTSGLIPLEVYEMIRKVSWLKASALVVNVVIAVYLAMHVRNEMIEKKRRRGESSAPLK